MLDLGSGDGIYSRLMIENGASEVIGVDLSKNMCSLARKNTESEAVKYLEGDCMNLEGMIKLLPEQEGAFDVVLCSWMICYARNVAELDALVEVISHFLKKATGVFAGTDNYPEVEDYEEDMFREDYEFSKLTPVDRSVQGGIIKIQLYNLGGDGSTVMPIENHYFSKECLQERFGRKGLSVLCPPLEVDPEISTRDKYSLMMEHPTFTILHGKHVKQ